MTKFDRLLKMELKKAFKNCFFLTAFCVGMLFSILSAVYNIQRYDDTQRMYLMMGGNPMVQASTLYNHWIGGEGVSLGSTLFFTLLPMLAAFPYGWSWCVERKSGYVRMAVIRGGKKNYVLAKACAVFLSGGLTVLIPLAVNFAAVTCFVPAVLPSVTYMPYYGVYHGTMWSGLFYTHPLIYVLLYLALDFVFAGLLAVAAMSVSVYVKNRVAVMILPYLAVLCLHQVRWMLYQILYSEVSPLYFLHASIMSSNTKGVVVFAEALILVLFSAFSLRKAGVWDEVW